MARGRDALIDDIKPAPGRGRSPLGVVEITLAPGQTVRAVGVVYGIEHGISGDGFEARLFLDQYNQRIKLVEYEATNYEAMVLAVRWLAEANGFDKVIAMAAQRDWHEFLRFGWVLEAVVKHYHDGDDAYVVSKFRSQERLTSVSLMEEILLVEKILSERAEVACSPLAAGHTLRMARRADIPALIDLYKSIFDSYPSPLMHVSYLETIFEKENVFAVIDRDGELVAASSAELHPRDRAAELTDCATRPEARGAGLMTHLIHFLEEDLVRRSYVCGYTMARARSYGMNRCFYRTGYTFMGRLVNNCDIYGAFEDMNIWVKRLAAEPPGVSQPTERARRGGGA